MGARIKFYFKKSNFIYPGAFSDQGLFSLVAPVNIYSSSLVQIITFSLKKQERCLGFIYSANTKVYMHINYHNKD